IPSSPISSYTLSLHDALPISLRAESLHGPRDRPIASANDAFAPRNASDDLGPGLLFRRVCRGWLRLVSRRLGAQQQSAPHGAARSEEHTSELQSRFDLVCRLL